MTLEADIRRKLAAYAPQERGDHALNPDLLRDGPYRRAAVLVPLVRRAEGLTVLFTQRTAHLKSHGGQVSFPGGGADGDETPMATALREAEEEIGLLPRNVTVLGALDRYLTRSSYAVTPVVGLVDAPEKWNPHSFEVETVFEVPLADILKPGALKPENAELEGKTRRFYVLNWHNWRIWGATAGMLHNLVEVITDEQL